MASETDLEAGLSEPVSSRPTQPLSRLAVQDLRTLVSFYFGEFHLKEVVRIDLVDNSIEVWSLVILNNEPVLEQNF